jgi:beta-lactamase class A
LTAVLGTNTIVSVVQTFTNMIAASLTKEEKEKELANVECILDFTLRMQNDLNTIYFETAFLQTSNDKIKQDIEALFRDYTKPIGFESTLENCRANDDWRP